MSAQASAVALAPGQGAERRAEARAGRGAAAQFHGVARRFGAVTVLERLDLDIPAGQFLAVVGRSGCGKSTLLRLLASLDEPSQGVVASAGAQATRIMFQEPRLLPWRRVLDNVEVGLPREVKGAERAERARAALADVGLAHRAGDWPATLSGGQKQRVALARALVSRPKLLLLDEPLGALDALTRLDMQRLIERIWREHGFTAVLVTHDVAEAVALADRIVVIERGAVALDVAADLPRPRAREDAQAAALEARVLARLLETP